MEEYVEFASKILADVKIVRFYRETFFHIYENHPEVRIELPSIYTAVEKAIVFPTHIEASYHGSYIFVDAESMNKSGDALRVPVKLVLPVGSARVRTAYFATVTNPTVVWRRRDA